MALYNKFSKIRSSDESYLCSKKTLNKLSLAICQQDCLIIGTIVDQSRLDTHDDATELDLDLSSHITVSAEKS